jgi:hypothetical protein
MATQITLPKDAEGREIPLDTKVLYNEDGCVLIAMRDIADRIRKLRGEGDE